MTFIQEAPTKRNFVVKEILSTQNLSLSTISGTQLLEKVSFKIHPGEVVVVLGENGAGKTTLLETLCGRWSNWTGEIMIFDRSGREQKPSVKEKLSFLSEKIDAPADWSTAEYLDFNSYFYPRYDHQMEKELLEYFSIDKKSRLGNLSTGQAKRVQIISELCAKPEIVIMDEITAVLDITARRKLNELIKKTSRDLNCSFLIATNILEDLHTFADRIIILKNGSIVKTLDVEKIEPISLSDVVVKTLEEK